MAAAWPLGDDVLLAGYEESPPANTISSPMGIGPDKKRRRTTSNPREIKFSVPVSKADVQTLDDFYLVDLFSGVLTFTWIHPRTEAPVVFRFKGEEKPKYQPLGGDRWQVALVLEVMP